MDEAQLAESGAGGEITIAARVHSGPAFPADACLLANGTWTNEECTLLATSHDGGETFGPTIRNFGLFQPPGEETPLTLSRNYVVPHQHYLPHMQPTPHTPDFPKQVTLLLR
jgi:hypothetical protein